MRKMLPFCSENSGPISVTSCSHEKDTRLSPRIRIHVQGEPGNEANPLDYGNDGTYFSAFVMLWASFIISRSSTSKSPAEQNIE